MLYDFRVDPLWDNRIERHGHLDAITVAVAYGNYLSNNQANIKEPAFPDYRNTSFAPYTSRVKVVVNPDGSVKSVSIYQTSGYPGADEATIQAALHSTYTPGSVNCQPVEGWYIFRADFNPD